MSDKFLNSSGLSHYDEKIKDYIDAKNFPKNYIDGQGEYATVENDLEHNEASGKYSHSEGSWTTASALGTHAEGDGTTAGAIGAHAEGLYTKALGAGSHAEGGYNTANGHYSHAEGYDESIADGLAAHAEGRSRAVGDFSHSGGSHTVAYGLCQRVFGSRNIPDPAFSDLEDAKTRSSERGTYLEIAGNGDNKGESNARTLDWQGNEVLAGKLTVGEEPTNGMDVATKNYADASILAKTGDLTALTTDNKDNLVNAINEVYEKSGEPFRVKNWATNTLNVAIPCCTTDITNTQIAKMTFTIDAVEGADYQIVGMIAYEVFDAATGGNRINCWPVCQFTGNGQKELGVRWMCGGTTDKVAKRINAWVLLKHR